jgi:NIPSNAP
MLLDVRSYIVRAGTLRAHLKIYEEYGFAPQKRHLGEPFAYLTTETGDVNSYLHIWLYEDAADRARRRAAMQADPDWIAYLKRSLEAGYLLSQHTQLMIPAPFATIVRPSA